MRTLKAAVIGLGVGEQHARAYAAHPRCELAALCDFSSEKRAWAEAEFPAARVTSDPDDILADGAIDVVSVASYDNHHGAQIVAAISAGKHVFAEKPLCLTRDEALAIRTALRRRPEVRLSCNLILRRCPRFAWLKGRIAAGDFGQVFAFEGDYNYGRIQKILGGWRGSIDGYSAMLGGGIHLIDLATWLTGERVAEVSAFGSRVATRGTAFRYDDYCAALLRLESGAVAKVSANLACVHPHFHAVSVYGTEATFHNGMPHGRLLRSRDPGHAWEDVTQAYPGSGKGDLIPAFINAILEDAPQAIGLDEIFGGMAVGFAIMEAAETRTVVPVRYF